MIDERDFISADDILLSITKPETEWVRGRALRKISPTRDHSRLQMKFAIVLDAWASGRGEVRTDARGKTVLTEGDVLSHPALPDFTFAISNYFADALRATL